MAHNEQPESEQASKHELDTITMDGLPDANVETRHLLVGSLTAKRDDRLRVTIRGRHLASWRDYGPSRKHRDRWRQYDLIEVDMDWWARANARRDARAATSTDSSTSTTIALSMLSTHAPPKPVQLYVVHVSMISSDPLEEDAYWFYPRQDNESAEQTIGRVLTRYDVSRSLAPLARLAGIEIPRSFVGGSDRVLADEDGLPACVNGCQQDAGACCSDCP